NRTARGTSRCCGSARRTRMAQVLEKARPQAASTRSPFVWLGLGLLGILLTQYLAALSASFMGDDFLFLDATRWTRFGELWKPNGIIAGYYRPLSRELHYWFFQRLFGPSAAVFHVINVGLWCAAILLFFALARRISDPVTAAVAACLALAQAAWGTTL